MLIMKIKQTLSRIYVNEIDSAIDFYEKLTGEKCSNRFEYNSVRLELAKVGNFLIIAGSDDSIKPFKETSTSVVVDSISEYKKYLLQHGGKIIRDIQIVPTGLNMTVKHEDGAVIEYVEFNIY